MTHSEKVIRYKQYIFLKEKTNAIDKKCLEVTNRIEMLPTNIKKHSVCHQKNYFHR